MIISSSMIGHPKLKRNEREYLAKQRVAFAELLRRVRTPRSLITTGSIAICCTYRQPAPQ